GVSAVKSRLDLVEVVRQYVDLRLVGGRWMGRCPFHQETKPSFTVHPEQGFYYCFGCRASGDVIDFYCKINGIDFREGLVQLAERAGVELTSMRPDPRAREKKEARQEILSMHALALEHYQANLRKSQGKIAREYLKKRGLTGEVARKFGLGYSLDDWHGLEKALKSRGFSAEKGVDSGLLVRNEKGNVYDRFRGRLMFPIQNLAGQAIAFGARTLTGDDPKYLNSSESAIYTKGDNLYGLFQARKSLSHTKTAILTEGYTDVLSLHQFGFENACGVLGTALTPNQVNRLSNFCASVDLVFDGDAAGKKAALRSAEMILVRGLKCRVVLLPEGEDVDGLLQSQGAEAFKVLLEQALDGFDFCLNTIRETFSPREITEWSGSFLRSLTQAGLQAYYIPKLAAGLGLAEAEIRRHFKASGARPESAPVRGKNENTDRWLLRFAIRNPDRVRDLAERGLGQALETGWAVCLWDKLTTCGQDDILSLLDASEKPFWVECRMQESGVPEDPERVGREIYEYLEGLRLKDREKKNFDALREAQRSGDQAGVLRLLQERQEIIRRGDE
ncbi:MAG: DNA primase, partial [Thermodesulfobacteriota bacterium]|nr:DNA primase [Thermodesulfobacteriota bacterium]